MKKIKTAISLLLTASIAASFAACEEEAPSNTSINAETTTGAPFKTMEKDSNVESAIKDATKDKEVEKLENPTVKWLAWWDIDRNSTQYLMFQDLYGGEIEYINSGAYADRYTKLQTMITSDDSPDLFPFEMGNYPFSADVLFQPVDDYLDLSDSAWDDTRDLIEAFKWRGKNYCPITTIDVMNVWWYRKSTIQEAGLQDPKALYEAGNWNWDTFLEMARAFQNSGTDKYAIDGWSPDVTIVASTGTPVVGIVDGKLVSNMHDENVERGVALLDTLAKEKLRYPRNESNSYQWGGPNAISKGTTLFIDSGAWFFSDPAGFEPYITKGRIEASDLMFVPAPKDPSTDEYYSIMRHEAYMLPVGAPNPEGYAAWNLCVLEAQKNPDVAEVAKQQLKDTYSWTDEQLDFLDEIKYGDKITPVFEFKDGLGQDICDGNSAQSPTQELLKGVYIVEDGETYAQIRAKHEEVILARINALNEGKIN